MSSGVSERASEQMSAADRASEASSAEPANEWALRANERTEEWMAQYSTRWISAHCAMSLFWWFSSRRNTGCISDWNLSSQCRTNHHSCLGHLHRFRMRANDLLQTQRPGYVSCHADVVLSALFILRIKPYFFTRLPFFAFSNVHVNMRAVPKIVISLHHLSVFPCQWLQGNRVSLASCNFIILFVVNRKGKNKIQMKKKVRDRKGNEIDWPKWNTSKIVLARAGCGPS